MIYSPSDKTQAFMSKLSKFSVKNKIDIFLRKPILRAFLFL